MNFLWVWLPEWVSEQVVSRLYLQGNMELVKLLLDHGANLRQTNLRGSTVLHEAAKGPSVEVFEFLRVSTRQRIGSLSRPTFL